MANWLVCLAVYFAYSAKDMAGKILGIIFPVMAFVAMGYEHSIANMYFIPAGILASGGMLEGLTWSAACNNILFALLGNIVGGSGLVGLVYWYCYLKADVQENH
jgi:formate/nitrite transporter FocA (FNT family)